MRIRKHFLPVLFCLCLLVTALSACQSQVEEDTTLTEDATAITDSQPAFAPPPTPTLIPEPVVLNWLAGSDIGTLDPQLAGDVVSINQIESLFVQLANYLGETTEVIPEATTGWEVSGDGLVYTFHLRDDIPWVQHNLETGETTQVLDKNGRPRFVTAADFVYGVKRICNPEVGAYGHGLVPVIKGCEALLSLADPADEAQFDKLYAAIGATAPDATTLVLELAFPASYFMQMIPMWTLSAAPSWTLEAHGDRWTEPGNIVTNGRYALHAWNHGVGWELWRNPLIPDELHGEGNIDRVVAKIVPDESTQYALWLKHDLDVTFIPLDEFETHMERYAAETRGTASMVVFYVSFRTTKAPFTDVQVRRAFSAAIDREALVQDLMLGQGSPLRHFGPPGIFGAPPINEVGVGFDPEYARAQLAAAGFPGCEGFPQVTIVTWPGADSLHQLEFFQGQWEGHLGCDPGLIQLQQLDFQDLLTTTGADEPDELVPHMWTLGWGPDYPDEDNMVGAVCACSGENRQKRVCSELDDLIVAARSEPDPQRRIALYRQIEEGFFGPEGEMPVIPLYTPVYYIAVHPWLEITLSDFGGATFYDWKLDADARQAALTGS